jgi:hypothetical protein
MYWFLDPSACIGPASDSHSLYVIHAYRLAVLDSLKSIIKTKRDIADRWDSCNLIRPFSRSVGIEQVDFVPNT